MKTNAILAIESLPPYLLERDILAPSDLIEYGFQIHDRTRRNRNFRVLAGRGPVALLKQGQTEGSDSATVHTEASMLRAFHSGPPFQMMSKFAPRLIDYNAEDCIIAVELVHPSTTLTKYHLNLGNFHFPREIGETAGVILAAFHEESLAAYQQGLLSTLVPRRIWSDDISGAHARASGVQKAYLALLMEMGFGARPQVAENHAPTHADPRWDNFLITTGRGHGKLVNLRLVDYELTRLDDPAWDVAFFLMEYLRFWLISCLGRPVTTLAEVEQSARFSLDLAKPQAQTFLASYLRRRKLSPAARAAFASRIQASLPYAFLTAGMENCQRQQHVPGTAKVLIELARMTRDTPSDMMQRLFGLEGKEWS